jgi:hypothetical protein
MFYRATKLFDILVCSEKETEKLGGEQLEIERK